jgi:hypothetical protein
LDNQMEKIQWMGSIHTSNNQIPRVEQNEKWMHFTTRFYFGEISACLDLKTFQTI